MSSAAPAAVTALCQDVLALGDATEGVRPGASCLNNDGVPLQLCLSTDHRGTVLRVIGDPGAGLDEPERRHQCARETLCRCLEAHGLRALSRLAETTYDMVIPSNAEGRSAYRQGFVWIAMSPDQSGVAAYFEMAPHGREQGWDVTRKWLDSTLSSSRKADQAIAGLRELCSVASVGFEGSAPQNVRAKVYFRLTRPQSLDVLGLELLKTVEMRDFLGIAMGEYGVDCQGLVMSIGFNVATGDLVDIKVDLCGHCLSYDPAGWLDVLQRLSRRFGLSLPSLDAALTSHDCAVAFVGLGLDTARKPRLNVYLKNGQARRTPLPPDLRAAAEDGIRYLCSTQHADGHWQDYRDLPVGTSDQWITAYVGLALAQYGRWLDHAAASQGARRAAVWLTDRRSYSDGWGYNGRTGPDVDSTAFVLALLGELEMPIAGADQAFLRRHWRSQGECGLATYEGPGAWGHAHWDVTPWGYLGLSKIDQDSLRDSFLAGLKDNRMADGMWRSYWWRNPYYSTFTTLEVLERLGISEPDAPLTTASSPRQIDNAFDLGCLIGIESLRAAAPERLGGYLQHLLSWQADDGRWPGHANLRVTDDTCYTPWEEPRGSYYTDEDATISTATVVRVLARLLAGREAQDRPVVASSSA
jgi:hypothetical protein